LDQASNNLLTSFSNGVVTLTIGYEADVAPRPNGSNNGTIAISDWAQMGRFTSGFDVPAPGSEFQRADCSPRSTFGNGTITISDWVQAGRYASGLDPVTQAAGPTTQGLAPIAQEGAKGSQTSTTEAVSKTVAQLVDGSITGDVQRTISVDLNTLGNENALGFSLMFDATKFTFVSAEKSDEFNLATLNVNSLEADKGRVGIALALPTGSTIGAGKHQVVLLTFKANSTESGALLMGFTDQPVAREIVDVKANVMPNSFEQPANGINPLEDPQFFVTQQYLDFLNRTPDAGGLDFWTNQLRECGSDAQCLSQRRVKVSAAFFTSAEFQQTGYTLYRFYKAAYGQAPNYQQFTADRGQLTAGPQLAANTQAFAEQFVARPEFRQAYPDTLSAEEFVTRLYNAAGLRNTGSERRKAIAALTSKQQTRAQLLLNLIEQKSFKEREYNSAFVLMQYFGYLRRDPDQGGFDFWLNVLNHTDAGNYTGMVCSFVTSAEYQLRFGALVPRSNQECGP
jgi:hypothetical protein